MSMHLGQSSIIHTQLQPNSISITKKISHYIFRFEDLIGQGNFSKVYKGFHQLTNEQVAIKIIELSSVKSPKLQELLFSQIEVIQSLNHPNILKCHEVLKSQNNCYIITQLCNGGDLQSLLKRQKCLNQISAAPYIRDIYKGLLYLGQRGIVHRDLKIANIFLHNGVSKIADFGFAKYTNNQNFFDLDIGSPLYMSPQGMIEHMYGMKTDIWAFGIIIYQLLHGKTPFSYCTTEYQLKRAVVNPISFLSLRNDLSNDMKQLIIKCLIVDQKNRPDALTLRFDKLIQRLVLSNHEEQRFVARTQPNIPQVQNINQSFQRQKVLYHANNPGVYIQKAQNPPSNQSFQNISYQNQNMQQPSYPRVDYVTPRQYDYGKAPQFSNNSPQSNKATNQNGSKISQNSQNTSQKDKILKPIQFSNERIQMSPNKINLYSNSAGSIQHSYNRTNSPTEILNKQIHRNNNLLIPQENFIVDKLSQKVRSPSKNKSEQSQNILPSKININTKSNDNFNKAISSSLSYNEQNKKKIPKTYSHQNVHKIQNQLFQFPQSNTKQIVNRQQNKSEIFKSPNAIQKSESSNQNLCISNSVKGLQINVHQISMNQKGDQNNQLNFKQEAKKSPKKFGQMIKGQKKPPESHVKSIIKLQKPTQLQPSYLSVRQKSKIKSQINIDKSFNLDVQQPLAVKKRAPRHSHGNIPEFNDMDGATDSVSSSINCNRMRLPSFIQEKQRLRQQLKRNLICSILQFKQAVGFLHYCRLYFRFVSTLKNVQGFPEIRRYDFLSQFLRNSQQIIQTCSRFLITALNELIENVRCKEILYDGQNYKRKKLKEDKLKQVTEEYFRKYLEEINKNAPKGRQILPVYLKCTSMEFIKQNIENFWESLDKDWSYIIQVSRKTNQMNDNFVKQFRNLCYFAIRIIEANEILANCMISKNYKLLSQTMIQNWLGQQFYGQQVYFKLKNQYFRKMNSSSVLQKSETNDTETQNKSRVNNLTLEV